MYKETSSPIKERVADLVSRMTLEEKISQMVFDAPAIERLGVPAYNWWNECLHGVGRAGVATVFPQAIGLAATWNAERMGQVAVAISDEGRAKHHEALRRGIQQIYTGLTFWSPNINIFRDPRWGRGQETYGEDPYLTAQMGTVFVKGLQGGDARYLKLVATPKHYAVHSGPERDRHHFDAVVGARDLRETYLPAFEACVKEGGAVSVMGAYNRVNGEPACASPTLLQQILREEWGFGGPEGEDGYIVSDCWAIRDIYAHHQVVATPEEAAALAVGNGCDLNCGSTYPALLEAVEQGLISQAAIDRAVTRLFTARFRLGMFDPPEQVAYAQIPYKVINSPQHRALALQAARESMVLLKNEGNLLPLPRDLETIAVVGPNADHLPVLIGNYSGTPAEAITPLEGIRRKLSPSTRLYHTPGCDLVDGSPLLEVIPSAFLRPAEAAARLTGLTAAYYANPDLQGEPLLSQVDRAVDFIWNDTTPLTGRWGDRFSVCWSGYLVPPLSGSYRLGAEGFSSYKLYLDGELVVEYTDMHQPLLRSKEVELEGGRLYPLRLEYVSRGLDPQIRLLWARPDVKPGSLALEAAGKADVIVAVMGLSPRLEGEEMPVQVNGFVGGDRSRIELPLLQEEFLKQLYVLGKPLVLVLLNGSALAIPWAARHIPAIVVAWYPGQAGGKALADILFGDYNPGGRLPITFYESTEDLPPFDDYRMAGRTYRFFQGEPLFPFGHGLSYTTFEYGHLQIEPAQVTMGGQVTVRADVTNSGDRAGDEVVQLYIRHLDAAVPRPIKELKGFQRLHLAPGERTTVAFTLHSHQLGYYDDEMHYALQPGRVEVWVGRSSSDLPLAGRFEIAGRPTRVDKVFFSQVRLGSEE
ncbi:MAG: glycoside hydrolase family 3 C-terminal domain-containing protein [Anaerolineae bacterium]